MILGYSRAKSLNKRKLEKEVRPQNFAQRKATVYNPGLVSTIGTPSVRSLMAIKLSVGSEYPVGEWATLRLIA